MTAEDIDDDGLWFALVQETKVHTEHVILSPTMWAKYTTHRGLSWTRVPFEAAAQSQVPAQEGLYAFAVRPPVADFPPSSWLFYVGEVGATGGNNRTLTVRFGEYLRELSKMKRPSIAAPLKLYNGHIDFYYCPLDHANDDIKQIEQDLITAMWPWANRADFAVDVRQVRRAF